MSSVLFSPPLIVDPHWPEALITVESAIDDTGVMWRDITLRCVTESIPDAGNMQGPFTVRMRTVIEDNMDATGIFAAVGTMIHKAVDLKFKPRVTSSVSRLIAERFEWDKARAC